MDLALIESGLRRKTLVFSVPLCSVSMGQMEAALELVTLLRTFYSIQVFIEVDMSKTPMLALLGCCFLTLCFNSMFIY